VIAGAAMALSSVSVVSNTLLLRRWQPPRPPGRGTPSAGEPAAAPQATPLGAQ
jgi:hypothetical protein